MTNNLTPIVWNFCPICGVALIVYTDGESDRPHCTQCQRHFYTNPTPAACCFVARDGKLLLGKRGIEPMRGQWALPGGYVELGETTAETALRELEEETGLCGKRARLIGVSSQQHVLTGAVIVLGYVIDEWEGDLRPGSDVEELHFFTRDEQPRLPFRAHRDLYAIYEALEMGQRPLPITPETHPLDPQ
jgi:ADP-ribose pyrophosphatase YjhB (NUDIX family)